MRWQAPVPGSGSAVARLELEEGSTGAFLYLFDDRLPGTRVGEEWYESAEAARASCTRRFGVAVHAWRPVS